MEMKEYQRLSIYSKVFYIEVFVIVIVTKERDFNRKVLIVVFFLCSLVNIMIKMVSDQL